MEKKTKVFLGVSAIAITLYLLFSKKAKGGTISENCTQNYCEYIIPSGTTFKDAKVHGTGGVAVKVNPLSKYDSGYRLLPKGSYKVTEVISNEKPSYAPYIQPYKIDNFDLYVEAKVNVVTTRDITEKYQNKLILFT